MNKLLFDPSTLRRPFLIFCGLAALSLLILFYQSTNVALVAFDAPAVVFQRIHSALVKSFFTMWGTDYWLGYPYGPISPDLNALLLRWTKYPFSLNLMISLNLLIAGIGMYFLLRTLELNTLARIFGALSFLLTNTVLTLVYPGHVNKIGTYAWIPFSVANFLIALREKKLRYYAISGAFLGLSLLGGEVQIPYYLGLWYTAWLSLFLWEQWKLNQLSPQIAIRHSGGLFLIAICALGLGASTTFNSLNALKSNTLGVGSNNPSQNWHFATQYYFPPEEILSCLTTIQFFGGPDAYWGRDGNPNPLRLSDDYMGLLPLGFAILGGIVCWRIWQARLFIIMGIGSLLISFGREGGLYWLLYQLPTMKSQRNPHRWSYFVALAVCVLAAYGINWLIHALSSKQTEIDDDLSIRQQDKLGLVPKSFSEIRNPKSEILKWARWQQALFATVILGTVLVVFTSILLQMPKAVAEIFYPPSALTSPQGPLFLDRTQMMLTSLVRTGIFLSLSAGAVWWLIHSKLRPLPLSGTKFKISPLTLWVALFLILTFDLGLNAKRYIRYYSWKDRYFKNELVNFLKQDPDLFRIKTIGTQQNQVLNDLVSSILPYHKFSVIDPPAISQMPTDYHDFFNYAQNHFLRSDRYFDLFNVKYLISPIPFSDPNTKLKLTAQLKGLNLYKRDNFMPRAWLVTSAKVIRKNKDAVLFATLYPGLNLRKTVVLEESPKVIPSEEGDLMSHPHKNEASPSQANTSTHSVHITHHEDNHIEIEVNTNTPAMLVVDEKWDPAWKAWVDRQPSKIYKANFLMRALELPPGKHTVVMEYRPSMIGFWISAISVSIFTLIGMGYAIRWLRSVA